MKKLLSQLHSHFKQLELAKKKLNQSTCRHSEVTAFFLFKFWSHIDRNHKKVLVRYNKHKIHERKTDFGLEYSQKCLVWWN